MNPVISVRDLSRTFPGTPEVHALLPCSFDVNSGEFVSIIGPSGSGKSTLMALLGLLDEATTGTYVLDGVDVSELTDSERSAIRSWRIGFLFQAFHLIGFRTVTENVALGLIYQGVGRSEATERSKETLVKLGLEHRLNSVCSKLSGGEQQRVAIARALVRHPALVLCDEPTGNLDSRNRNIVLETLTNLNGEGLTIVVITHDPEVAACTSRTFEIFDGQVSERTPQQMGVQSQ